MIGSIVGISLLVGGIGIVLERTDKIGLRRPVSAKRWDIRFPFLVGTFPIRLMEGLVGILMGAVIQWNVRSASGGANRGSQPDLGADV